MVDDLVTAIALSHEFVTLPELHLSSALTAPAMIAPWGMIWLSATRSAKVPRHFFIAPVIRSVVGYCRSVSTAVLGDPNELGVAIRAELIRRVSLITAPLTRILNSFP